MLAEPPRVIRLTRRELYDVVWAEPMRTLAARYAISNVGLAKACRRMRVPVPGRGYWRRKETGHPVVQERLPALPASAGADLREIVLTRRAAPSLAASDGPGAADGTPATPAFRQTADEADPARRIPVAPTVNAAAPLHPLVRQTQVALRGAPADDRGRLYPFVRDGYVPVGPPDLRAQYERTRAGRPPAALHAFVTPPAVDRALRVLDALLKALEARGYPIFCDLRRGVPAYGYIAAQFPTDHWRRYVPVMTRVEVGEEDVFLVLREVVSRVEPAPPADVGQVPATRRRGTRPPALIAVSSPDPPVEYVGSGRFVLTIPHTPGNYPAFWTWEEGKGKRNPRAPLEEVLGDVVVAVVAAGHEFRAWRERAIARERDARERAHRELEDQQRRAAEAAKAQRLEHEAAAYARAGQIRAYAAALRAAGAGPGDVVPPGPLRDWITYAEAHADRVDPVRTRVADSPG